MQQQINVPANIIKPKQMQEVLWDMIRADTLAQEIIKKDSAKNFTVQIDTLT